MVRHCSQLGFFFLKIETRMIYDKNESFHLDLTYFVITLLQWDWEEILD